MSMRNKTWKEAFRAWMRKKAALRPPDKLIKEMARCLLPDIVAYCESEEGKAAFQEWQEKEKSRAS